MIIHVKSLDPKRTHAGNPHCQMRMLMDSAGQWYCADCGVHILMTEIPVSVGPQHRGLSTPKSGLHVTGVKGPTWSGKKPDPPEETTEEPS
jgi:hypothetical protein